MSLRHSPKSADTAVARATARSCIVSRLAGPLVTSSSPDCVSPMNFLSSFSPSLPPSMRKFELSVVGSNVRTYWPACLCVDGGA